MVTFIKWSRLTADFLCVTLFFKLKHSQYKGGKSLKSQKVSNYNTQEEEATCNTQEANETYKIQKTPSPSFTRGFCTVL